jgi:membrane-bound metal-dependent hydrolase YbcI (DUF457 family)
MAMPPSVSPAAPVPDDGRRGFLHHVMAFAVVVALLAALNWYIGKPYWVEWVFLGWGAGLVLHAVLLRRHR